MVGNFALTLAALPLAGLAMATLPPQPLVDRSNSTVPIYRNPLYCVDDRVEDLLSRMTLAEKAGQMFHTMLPMGDNHTLSDVSREMINGKLMAHFNLNGAIIDARASAEWYNAAQRAALDTRLGIPITLSSDPRHHASIVGGASVDPGAFSRWPEPLGFAAIRDTEIVRTFANIAREEYIAVGLRAALHPQVDLATEPRWARIFHSWSEDADLTSKMIVAYIEGFQSKEFGAHSVTTVTKHFPGGGPVEKGHDSHFTYGKNATYPGHNFDHHLIPFKAAIAAGARQMLPYYSRPIGTEWEEVGFAFNRAIITGLLREELGFEGIILTDWGLITDSTVGPFDFPARAWGLEDKSEEERAFRILDAGCDQFGGETRTDLIIKLVESGRIKEERLDVSIRRLLREKFLLGLFENPFVDPDYAEEIVGNSFFRRLGEEAQRRSYTLLSNADEFLPLGGLEHSTRIYSEGIDTALLEARGYTVVNTPEEADLALLRPPPPFDPMPGTLTGLFGFCTGSLEYNSTEKARQAAIYAAVPTVVDLYIDRPIAVPEVFEQAKAVLGSYGSTDDAFLDIVLGVAEPEGKLPFDLPRSNAAVEAQYEDVPFDTIDPVLRFDHGLRYAPRKCGRNCVRRH